MVELFDSFDKPEVPFLYQIKKQHAASPVTLGNADHQPEVCFRQFHFGNGVAFAHAAGKLDFFFRR
jgi:hypothetical protein